MVECKNNIITKCKCSVHHEAIDYNRERTFCQYILHSKAPYNPVTNSHSQSHTRRPHVHLEPRKSVKAIGNLWRLECWRSLAGPTCVVYSKHIQGLFINANTQSGYFHLLFLQLFWFVKLCWMLSHSSVPKHAATVNNKTLSKHPWSTVSFQTCSVYSMVLYRRPSQWRDDFYNKYQTSERNCVHTHRLEPLQWCCARMLMCWGYPTPSSSPVS